MEYVDQHFRIKYTKSMLKTQSGAYTVLTEAEFSGY